MTQASSYSGLFLILTEAIKYSRAKLHATQWKEPNSTHVGSFDGFSFLWSFKLEKSAKNFLRKWTWTSLVPLKAKNSTSSFL